ncbi:conserved hypothetical protein [Ricinus communis]|uniref:Uncharacterized protein n=1 Tax=Ricinus communis TaxID=3988 RepID=B9RYR5_RICCO|nr:conserved hypothetical protein [Ricinus communis]
MASLYTKWWSDHWWVVVVMVVVYSTLRPGPPLISRSPPPDHPGGPILFTTRQTDKCTLFPQSFPFRRKKLYTENVYSP